MPDSIISEGTWRNPKMVFLTIGGNEYIRLAKRPTVVPKPNSNNIGNRYAKAGTVCKKSNVGLIIFSAFSGCVYIFYNVHSLTPLNFLEHFFIR